MHAVDNMHTMDAKDNLPWPGGLSLSAQLAILGLGLVVAYNLTYYIYNIFLHPLRRFPGSPQHAASSLPVVWANICGVQPMWVRALHARYGPVVRIAPDELSFTSPDSWRQIYGAAPGSRGGSITDKVEELYGTGLFPDTTTPINAELSDVEHARIRRTFAPAFTDKALREQEPLFDEHVGRLVEKIKTRVTAEEGLAKLDAVHWYKLCTFDIMSELAFGRPLGLLQTGEYDAWLTSIFSTLKAISILSLLRYYPALKALWKMFLPRFVAQKRLILLRYAVEKVDARMADQGVTKPDIWRLVMDAGEKDNISRDEMVANCEVMLFGGSDTTATALSGTTYFLVKHPDKMVKLVEEIRGAFKSESEMTLQNVTKLQYLDACINEAMRLHPPGPQNFPRRIRPGGANICGYHIPPKMFVTAQLWPASTSDTYFRRPLEFIPERWFSSEFSSDDRRVAQFFSYGPRNCIGKSMAYLELRKVLCRILWNFDLELCPESADWIDQKVYFTWEHTELMVNFKPVVR